MYSKLMNNVRFCLCLCAVVALIGLVIGLVLYFKDDTAYAFVVTVGSGLLLFIVVIVASLTFRCLVTRSRLLHSQQRLSGDYPRSVKVLNDPPPPYKKAWGKEFQRNLDTFDRLSQSSRGSVIRPLEGFKNVRTSLDKLTDFEIQRQGVVESPADEGLPTYDVAIRELSARSLQTLYREQLSLQMEEGVMASSGSCFGKETCSPFKQVCPQLNLGSCYPHHKHVAEVAPVHSPSKTVVSIVACFDNPSPTEDSVTVTIEG